MFVLSLAFLAGSFLVGVYTGHRLSDQTPGPKELRSPAWLLVNLVLVISFVLAIGGWMVSQNIIPGCFTAFLAGALASIYAPPAWKWLCYWLAPLDGSQEPINEPFDRNSRYNPQPSQERQRQGAIRFLTR